MSTYLAGPSAVSRDAELADARRIVAALRNALARVEPLAAAAGESFMPAIDEAVEASAAFLSRTAYLGEPGGNDAALDGQVVAHAAKTLRARADATDFSVIWDDMAWLGCLQLMPPGGDPVPLSEGDQRWFATMTPEAGRALADLLDGRGTAAAVARAVLHRDEREDAEDE